MTLETGYFLADGGAMFGAIPKRAWSRKYPCDENNLCRLAMRCVLAVSDSRKILIDTGIKVENIERFCYYNFQEIKQIDDCIAELGYNMEDITDVVLTHFHFDHCGASTRKNEHEEWIPMFPRATYWASLSQWENAQHPNGLEADSFLLEDFIPLKGCITLIENDTTIDSHFRMKLFDGHTHGQIVCYIDGDDGNYLVPSDVIPTSQHISAAWISAYDIHAEASWKSKMEILEDAVKENRELIFYHDCYIQSAKVVKNNSTITIQRK